MAPQSEASAYGASADCVCVPCVCDRIAIAASNVARPRKPPSEVVGMAGHACMFSC
jgi:hypothetical protein